MGNKLGYGGLLLGVVLIIGGFFHRISVGNPGGPPPGAGEDQQAIRVATNLMIAGGALAVVGALAGYLVERRKRKDDSPAEKDAPAERPRK
jgi:hypothetical protein